MKRMLVVLGTTLLLAAPAHAGGGTGGDWELGVYGGYGTLDDYGIFHLKNDLLFGARLGYFFTPLVSLELSGQHFPTETEFEAADFAPLPTPAEADATLDAGRLNLLLNFGSPGSFVRPFLTVGGGIERVDIEGYGDSSDFGWNAGAGLRWFLGRSWNLRTEGRFVQVSVGEDVDDATQENIEGQIGLSVLFGGGGETVAAAPNQAPTVSCAAARSEILPGETVQLTATATDPEGDPLTFVWSTTAGRISGSGASATLDFTGATAPASATVTVRVSDNHGNTSTSDCGVRLAEAAKPAESVSCLAGGFPRNLSRLNNVDKACLDDVVQRLKTDPRARVVVIGHADTGERSAETVSQQRAAAVRDYLAQAGVESARITVRSVGSSRVLASATDASQNRRVEVWFVPEGAKEPE